MTLPRVVRSAVIPKRSFAPPRRNPESRHYLVEDEKRTRVVGQRPQSLKEPRVRLNESSVADNRLDDDCRHSARVVAHEFRGRVEIIERRCQSQRRKLRRHSRRIRQAQCRHSRAGMNQKGIGVAVITAVEL
jgi:hypothetical protein